LIDIEIQYPNKTKPNPTVLKKTNRPEKTLNPNPKRKPKPKIQYQSTFFLSNESPFKIRIQIQSLKKQRRPSDEKKD